MDTSLEGKLQYYIKPHMRGRPALRGELAIMSNLLTKTTMKISVIFQLCIMYTFKST